MDDPDIISYKTQIFSQQSPVTMVGLVFAAQQAVFVKRFNIGFLRDFSDIQQVQIFGFIFLPSQFVGPVARQKLLGWREVEVMFVGNIAYGSGKVFKIGPFCETG